MKTLHRVILIFVCVILASVVSLQTVNATVPFVEIRLLGETDNQNCENKCVISQIVNVQKGTAVEWVNNDLVPHTLVSGVPGDVDNGTLFDTGPIWVGKFLIHDFDDVGVYHYFEKDHPQNTGVINVTDWTYPKLLSQTMTDLHTTEASPLKQLKSGIVANNVTCNHGLELILKSEDGSPACVTPDTAQKLTEGGWALTKLTINGLKEIYGVGEKIDFMIDFQGLLHYCDYPHVSILDSNQNIVWKSQDVNSMCVSAPFSPLPYSNQNFDLNSGYGGPIMIDKVGNYTVKVSLYGSNVEKGFIVK